MLIQSITCLISPCGVSGRSSRFAFKIAPDPVLEFTVNIGSSVISLLFIGVTLMIEPKEIWVSYWLPKLSVTVSPSSYPKPGLTIVTLSIIGGTSSEIGYNCP